MVERGNLRGRVSTVVMVQGRPMASGTRVVMRMIRGGECLFSPSEVDEEGRQSTQVVRPGCCRPRVEAQRGGR